MVRMEHPMHSRFIGIAEPGFVRFDGCRRSWPELSAARRRQDASCRSNSNQPVRSIENLPGRPSLKP